MNDYDYTGTRVLITGVGRHPLGSNNSAARFFVRAGATVIITDEKPADELAEGLAHLKDLKVTYRLGGYRVPDFRWADIVIRNPGNRALEPFLAIARKHDAKVTTDIGMFSALAPEVFTIGVTGTRGKSTTTALIGEISKAAGRKTKVGGNIRVSPLTFLPLRTPAKSAPTIVVLELSSWLLEGFAAEGCAPRIAVVTNVMRDHLNTYDSMADYAAAKAEVFRAQGPGDAAVLNRDNAITRRFGASVPGRRFWISARPFSGEQGAFFRGSDMIFRSEGREEVIAKRSDIRHLVGDHNAMNALAAACAAKIAGLSDRAIVRALRSFRGLPDRLERLRVLKGIEYWNDTTATTPDGTIAALRTLAAGAKRKRVVLIAGGKDKELAFGELAREIRRHAKALVLFKGTATDKLLVALRRAGASTKDIAVVTDMKSAVAQALSAARRGDAVVLSPGAASFGLFKNEFDRGDQFRALIKRLR